MINNRPKVLFFLVKDTPTKLSKITLVAQYHFSRKERLLIATLDHSALQFLDELLWKSPEESFLPHTLSDSPCEDLIVITTKRQNLNSARYIFNLCPTPLFFPDNPKTIYELEDRTTPAKHLLSQKRFEAYKEAKYPIESR